jgi:uncharacterized membrane protein
VPTVLLAAVAIGWLVLLVAAPVAPAPIATLVYAIGSLICHQRPERSFHLDAIQLPVCARCLGIYAGAAAGTLSRLVPGSDPGSDPAGSDPTFRAFRTRPLLIVAAVPTVVTLVLEWTGLWAPGNVVRAVAGVPLGVAAALVLVPRLRVHY